MREKEHEEYNALTKRLLEKGYSAEHHPEYVRADVPMWQEKSLDNYDGCFTYENDLSGTLFEGQVDTPDCACFRYGKTGFRE